MMTLMTDHNINVKHMRFKKFLNSFEFLLNSLETSSISLYAFKGKNKVEYAGFDKNQ